MTGQDAFKLALADSRLPVTDTMRVAEIDAVLHRINPNPNPNPKWEFLFRDGNSSFQVTAQEGIDITINESMSSDRALPAFFTSLPPLSEVEMPEVYLEQAKEAWVAEDERITLRPEYIIAYSLCAPAQGGSTCAISERAKETWQVVLRADVEGDDRAIVRSIGFENGTFVGIRDVRIWGNW